MGTLNTLQSISPSSTVALPRNLADEINQFLREQETGQLILHVKEGKVLQIDTMKRTRVEP